MSTPKVLLVALCSMGFLMAYPLPTFAEEHVRGTWNAEGKLFWLAPQERVFHDTAIGEVTHTKGKGQFRSAILFCSFSKRVDEIMNREEGNGFCTFITNKDDKVYGQFHCNGPIKYCKGKFLHLGGIGAYQGIYGETELLWKAHSFLGNTSKKKTDKFFDVRDSSDLDVHGAFVLPNLTYSLSNRS